MTVSAQAGATSVASKSVLEWVRGPCITHSKVLNKVTGASTQVTVVQSTTKILCKLEAQAVVHVTGAPCSWEPARIVELKSARAAAYCT